MRKQKILIVGAGAIGAFYGALLAKAGANVAVVCRSDYEQVKKHGYKILSDTLGNWTFVPTQVVKHANEYQGEADHIFLCTKITSKTNRVQVIKSAVNEHNSIIFIQNGVEIEQELIDAYPNNEIISGLAFICCNRVQPGIIHHIAYGKLTLGSLSNISNKAHQLSQLINSVGIESICTENIITSRWLKCLWNAAFNPLSVLSDGLSTKEILTSQEKLIRTIMQEVCNIAQACGHPLPEDSINTNIDNTYKMPPYKTSMLLDYQNGNSMEIEVILGNTIKAAKRTNTACPTLNTLYSLMKLKEHHIKPPDYP